MIVLDAGAAAELLAMREPQGTWVADHLAGWGPLRAPHLIDFEVASTLRRWVLRKELSASRGRSALTGLSTLPLGRVPAIRLLERVWELRHNLTAYDAAYVALAEALDAPLVTTDERLARSTGHTATILHPA